MTSYVCRDAQEASEMTYDSIENDDSQEVVKMAAKDTNIHALKDKKYESIDV